MVSFGNKVSRVLDPISKQFSAIVWQKNKPPLDSELNCMAQIEWERMQNTLRSMMPSGWLIQPLCSKLDFKCDSLFSNLFYFGNPKDPTGQNESSEQSPLLWAHVNGWIVPVAGSNSDNVVNKILLNPSPESDSRVDFVFLEVWQTLIAPNPSTSNKPTRSTIWKYGNVEFGGTNPSDDLEDTTLRFETTKRVQVQYRLRVKGSGVGAGAGVALDVYPEGLDDPNVLAQGASDEPVSGMVFENMREELGDSGLWRAGDGDPDNGLGTIDGYVYAIPVCAVFRRNSSNYVAVTSSGNPNQNGAFDRNPLARTLPNPTDLSRVLTQAILNGSLGPSTTGEVGIEDMNGSGLEDTEISFPLYLVIDQEIIEIDSLNLNEKTINITQRGLRGTDAVGHTEGASVYFYNNRPDGLYADQIVSSDILDLRHAVSPNNWNYNQLLEGVLSDLVTGDLHTSWKQSGTSDTQGIRVHEVSYLYADGSESVPNHTDALDGPDGIRTIWSDAAVIQSDITVLCDNEATTDSNGVGLTTADQFDTNVIWDVGADFKPVGFLNVADTGSQAFTNGSSVFLFIGGADGTQGARGSFRDGSEKAVRFVTPKEYWKKAYPVVNPQEGNQHPFSLRFISVKAYEPAPSNDISEDHTGPMYPWQPLNFEKPFIVLGGVLNESLKVSDVPVSSFTNAVAGVDPYVEDSAQGYEIDLGVDFNSFGQFFSIDDNNEFESDPSVIANPLMGGRRTLFDMLTDYGRDRTGASSEVYVVLYGDALSTNNNGAFKVIGAGTVGYTNRNASNATSIVVEPLSADFEEFDTATGNTVTVEFRSQYHNVDDVSDYESRYADLAIVFTDLGGVSNHPWQDVSGDGVVEIGGGGGKVGVESKLLISTSVLYSPGRAAMARVPEQVTDVVLKNGNETYLQQPASVLDSTFPDVVEGEASFEKQPLQTFNRLSAYGWHAPDAPAYGGEVVNFTEIERESQVFLDNGSKTFMFRPFRDREMTLQAFTFTAGTDITAGQGLLGSLTYPDTTPKDGLSLWTANQRVAFALPREYMPRFGRQDIPYYKDMLSGTGNFLPGINHLLTDCADPTEPVFHLIGGSSNTSGGNQVKTLHFVTNVPASYGHTANTIGVINNVPNVYARKTTDIDANDQYAPEIIANLNKIQSSDLGPGLKGIQLPPYYGIARLLGVYERANYIAKGGRTFKSNRFEAETDPATNLLKEDAVAQSLYILQNGAKDLTLQDGDHTYIIPENVLDLSRISSYTDNSTFDDFEYVVVATVFGFSKDFINGNNYVLCRRYNGQGSLISDGDNPLLEGVRMTIPCAASFNDQVYISYNRTVYQGDVFGTRDGTSRNLSDFEPRYGQISIENQYELKTPIQQFDSDGNLLPQTSNLRVFEVLASQDFVTTLGTGKMSGKVYASTVTDVGFTSQDGHTRLPASDTDPQWFVKTRAFTEGQGANTSRSALTLDLLNPEALGDADAWSDAYGLRFTLLDSSRVTMFFGPFQSLNGQTILGQTVVPRDIIDVDDSTLITKTQRLSLSGLDLGTLNPVFDGDGNFYNSLVLSSGTYQELTGLTPTNCNIKVYPRSRIGNDILGGVSFLAIPGTNQITLYASYNIGVYPLTENNDLDTLLLRRETIDIGNVTAGSSKTVTLTLNELESSDINAVFVKPVDPSNNINRLILNAHVSNDNEITVTAYNPTASGVNPGSQDFDILVVRNSALLEGVALDLSEIDLDIEINTYEQDPDLILDNLVSKVNDHSSLQRTLVAIKESNTRVRFEAYEAGEVGNLLQCEVVRGSYGSSSGDKTLPNVTKVLRLKTPQPANKPVGANITKLNFCGGKDLFVNAGQGFSSLTLTGLTEKLPLGILVNDSDFLCENPLRDSSSALKTFPSGIFPIQTEIPLINGSEYSRFTGAPGDLIAMSDGSILSYSAYTSDNPSGTRKFRLYRGGGSLFVLQGNNPGGPVAWSSGSWVSSLNPVLKGGLLVCKALLVRNYYEEAFASNLTLSQGDEVQLIILTYAVLGNGDTQNQGIALEGIISPTGYGEGYAASDRYRIPGRPIMRTWTRYVPNPYELTLAPYPFVTR